VISAPEVIAAILQAPAGEPLAHLERLRLANGEPMSIENAYLVHRFCAGVLDRHDYTQEPLRESLEKDYGIRLVNAKQIIRAVSATPAQARLLRVPAKSPLLFIERVSFSQASLPIEYLKIFYRADRYSLFSELNE
jgi:GntR family transcriptional regulator